MNTPKCQPVIKSLMDTDAYKKSMQQAILHSHPGAEAEYVFLCRNNPEIPLSSLYEEVNEELDALCSLRYTQDELDYMRDRYYIKSDYVDFLEGFQLRRRFIDVKKNGDKLEIRAKGPMVQVMPFEIYTLAIVNEVYFRRFETPEVIEEGKRRLKAKMEQLVGYLDLPGNRAANPFEFFDFGTRRRFSQAWQEQVVAALAKTLPEYFKGTSNVDLARRLNLVPIGTMAHEYLQAYQGFGFRLRDFQKAALEGWVQEYRGDLGIALTDVVGMDAFLRDFDRYFAKLFDGLRHDSGDPFEWGEKALKRYAELNISPADKRFVFSDGLDMSKALALYDRFANRVKTGFGMGTNLTNDLGPVPLQIVMKLIQVNGQSVAKLPDTPGKTASEDKPFLEYLAQVFGK